MQWRRGHEQVHDFDNDSRRFSCAKVVDCYVGENGVCVYALEFTDGRVQHVSAEEVHSIANQRVLALCRHSPSVHKCTRSAVVHWVQYKRVEVILKSRETLNPLLLLNFCELSLTQRCLRASTRPQVP